ncbi:cytochrome P450 [Aspergillus tubingensis]|uniref:Cytochrome P450 n=1 Tax=Aspergillus niger TaxID=5061 RepID=A0A117DWP2_ASPNG|nr:cytochrome P450 [Aspergillus tubingensis]GAQ36803.1 cytochrome P450 [Aspergillus niger]GFN14738.1 cytochrome P450 [Aspergillus tubingensis]
MNIAQRLSSLEWHDRLNMDLSILRIYICLSAAFIVVFIFGLAFYRLYLSPLAKFPGPRLAAATGLYETYYDVVRDGQFSSHIERLHQTYGPIVRIKPWELHVKDPDNYNTLYAGVTRKRNKDSWFSFAGWPDSIFSTNGHALHRSRRSVLAQFFRRQAILDVQPLIRDNIQALCRHFRKAQAGYHSLELYTTFFCFTSDTISQYAFGKQNGFHYLGEAELDVACKSKAHSIFELSQKTRHFPWLCKLVHFCPWPALLMNADFARVYAQEMEVQSMVRKAILGRGKGCSEKPKPIYPAILNNEKVPEDEKRLARLTDDAIFLVQAGTDAPGRALVLTLYYILRDPEVHKKLRSELCAAWPDATMEPGLIALEQLPYFTAVLKEGLRLSSLVSTRLPRVAPDEELHFHGYEIPRGVPVSMTTFFILRDPKIFPEPLQFIPERWLLEPEDLRKLERYLVPFSKGTLGCMGQSMAWAWLYMVLGTLLRRFEMRLYDTTERNVTPVRDKFLWQTEPGLNRVQIKVLREYS